MLHQWEDDGRHWLLIRRSLADPSEKAYYFVFAPQATTLPEMVKAIGTRWRVEEHFENGKDLGLDHYEVRSFIGWYRHITLVLLALAYLAGICATERFPTGHPRTSEAATQPCVLPLTIVFRAPFARTAHLAFVFVHTPSAYLVVVASLPPKHGELLPHQTSSECWLIMARSFPRFLRNVLEVPEFLEIGARVVSHLFFP